jgi:hypothetical protein
MINRQKRAKKKSGHLARLKDEMVYFIFSLTHLIYLKHLLNKLMREKKKI